MPDPRALLSTLLYCLWLPTSNILSALRFVLSPFCALAQFTFLPVAHLLHTLYAVVSLPFRLHLLERIEVRWPCHYDAHQTTYHILQTTTHAKAATPC